MPLSNSIPVLPEISYQHQCGCHFTGMIVVIHPEVKGNFYIEQTPMCVEKMNCQLVRIGDNSVSGN